MASKPDSSSQASQLTDVMKQRPTDTVRTYRDVFTGSTLIDYLMERGLAADRYRGLDFGRDLLMGDLIVHVSHEHHFHDCGYYYRFCTPADAKRKMSSMERRGSISVARAGSTASAASVVV